jgi:hypothetical protein
MESWAWLARPNAPDVGSAWDQQYAATHPGYVPTPPMQVPSPMRGELARMLLQQQGQ